MSCDHEHVFVVKLLKYWIKIYIKFLY